MKTIMSLQINMVAEKIRGPPDPDRKIGRHLMHNLHQVEDRAASLRIKGKTVVKRFGKAMEITSQISEPTQGRQGDRLIPKAL